MFSYQHKKCTDYTYYEKQKSVECDKRICYNIYVNIIDRRWRDGNKSGLLVGVVKRIRI